jgi:hypothetical protein
MRQSSSDASSERMAATAEEHRCDHLDRMHSQRLEPETGTVRCDPWRRARHRPSSVLHGGPASGGASLRLTERFSRLRAPWMTPSHEPPPLAASQRRAPCLSRRTPLDAMTLQLLRQPPTNALRRTGIHECGLRMATGRQRSEAAHEPPLLATSLSAQTKRVVASYRTRNADRQTFRDFESHRYG